MKQKNRSSKNYYKDSKQQTTNIQLNVPKHQQTKQLDLIFLLILRERKKRKLSFTAMIMFKFDDDLDTVTKHGLYKSCLSQKSRLCYLPNFNFLVFLFLLFDGIYIFLVCFSFSILFFNNKIKQCVHTYIFFSKIITFSFKFIDRAKIILSLFFYLFMYI